MSRFELAAATAALLLVSGAALADKAGPAQVMQDEDVGRYLATEEGMTLYTYADDAAGKSTCTGRCAEVWPPFRPEGEKAQASGEWTVIDRPDGSKQWAYDGNPLYTFVQDERSGIVKGHGVEGEWWVAKPEG